MARGDHYEVSRFGYRHHGIDIGDGTVVHFTGEPMRKLQAAVQRTSWQEFIRGDPYKLVAYPGWTWTPDHVCLRALRLVGMTGYDLVRRNCEHFASFCKVGQGRSHQIEQSAKNVMKYSKFVAVNPAGILAGPAYEAGRRLLGAAVHAARKAAVSPSVPPTQLQEAALGSYFHYLDLYVRQTLQPEGVVLRPYGDWFRLADGSPLPQSDATAVFTGRVYVDDSLMIYRLSADGFYRYAPGDDQVRFVGVLYDHQGTAYRLSTDNTWAQLTDGGRQPVPTAPPGSTIQANIFQNAQGVIYLKTRPGWFVEQHGGWVQEEPFRTVLRFV